MTVPNNNIDLSTTLKQGLRFKQYQNKIKKRTTNIRGKFNKEPGALFEGFTSQIEGINSNTVQQTAQVLRDNRIPPSKLQELNSLETQFQNLLWGYQSALNNVDSTTGTYVASSNSKNPYVNTNIQLQNGNIGYVTGEGTYKSYGIGNNAYSSTAGKNGCPSNYTTIGSSVLPSNIEMGDPMTYGQSCGNEGKNVYVNTVNNNPNVNYIGAFSDSNSIASSMSLVYSGNGTYELCKEFASNNGYAFFALTNSNPSTQTCDCYVSNVTPSSFTNVVPGSGCNSGGSGSPPMGSSSTLAVYKTMTQPTYIGTYVDAGEPNRAMYWDQYSWINMDQCISLAQQRGATYFGMQDGNMNGVAACLTSNDLTESEKYGATNNFFTNNDGNIIGGPWANAIYQTPGVNNANSSFVGCYDVSPSTFIYVLATFGIDTQPTDINNYCEYNARIHGFPYYAIRYNGQYIEGLVGQTLEQLTVGGTATQIKVFNDGKTYGMGSVVTLYNITNPGYPGNVGKMGYISDNSILSEYPTSMYAADGSSVSNSVSCSKSIVNIDSIQWQNYVKSPQSMTVDTPCGLKRALVSDNMYLDAAGTQMVSVAQELVDMITSLEQNYNNLYEQMGIDKAVLAANLLLYKKVIAEYKIARKKMTNIDNISTDSDITVLRENYLYTFWTILAIAAIIVTMNLIKRGR